MIYLRGKNKKDLKMIVRLMKKLKIIVTNVVGTTTGDETEWVETVNAGWNVVVGADHKKIVDAVRFFKRPDHLSDLYGDGRAGEKIVEILVNDGCLGFSNHCKTRNNY